MPAPAVAQPPRDVTPAVAHGVAPATEAELLSDEQLKRALAARHVEYDDVIATDRTALLMLYQKAICPQPQRTRRASTRMQHHPDAVAQFREAVVVHGMQRMRVTAHNNNNNNNNNTHTHTHTQTIRKQYVEFAFLLQPPLGTSFVQNVKHLLQRFSRERLQLCVWGLFHGSSSG